MEEWRLRNLYRAGSSASSSVLSAPDLHNLDRHQPCIHLCASNLSFIFASYNTFCCSSRIAASRASFSCCCIFAMRYFSSGPLPLPRFRCPDELPRLAGLLPLLLLFMLPVPLCGRLEVGVMDLLPARLLAGVLRQLSDRLSGLATVYIGSTPSLASFARIKSVI